MEQTILTLDRLAQKIKESKLGNSNNKIAAPSNNFYASKNIKRFVEVNRAQ